MLSIVATSVFTEYVIERREAPAPSRPGLDLCPGELVGFGSSALSSACSCLVHRSATTETSTLTNPAVTTTISVRVHPLSPLCLLQLGFVLECRNTLSLRRSQILGHITLPRAMKSTNLNSRLPCLRQRA